MDVALEVDVCVAGAGPAGAAFALRMAGLGYQVAVIARPVRGARVGEALTPGAWPLLETLGVHRHVASAGFRASRVATVRWESDQAVQVVSGRPGLVVDRDRFDGLLLAAASARARIVAPATAGRPRALSDGWEVPVRAAGGQSTIHARFLADATGRARLSGGRREWRGARTLALHALWQAAWRGAPTVVDVGPEGWAWATTLPDGHLHVMAFADPEGRRKVGARGGGSNEWLRQWYLKLLFAAPVMSEVLQGAHLVGPVAACDATAYSDPAPVSERSIKLGEASFALDPLSSSGIEKALQSAVSGSAAVHTMLSFPAQAEAARQYYADSQQASAAQHALWAAGYYASHSQWADAAFWRRRSALAGPIPGPAGRPAVEERPPRAAALRFGASPASVGLARDVTVAPAPCIVGDHVEERLALHHPTLARPVAFLGEVELGPLVVSIGEGQPLEELLTAWATRVARRKAVGVADWLAARELLVPVAPPGP